MRTEVDNSTYMEEMDNYSPYVLMSNVISPCRLIITVSLNVPLLSYYHLNYR